MDPRSFEPNNPLARALYGNGRDGARRDDDSARVALRRLAGSRLLLPLLFAAIALPLGILLAVIVPRGQNADEAAHIIRADSLSRGELIGRRDVATSDGRQIIVAGVDADPVWPPLSSVLPYFRTPPKLGVVKLFVAETMPWGGHAVFIDIGSIASYMPLLYLPGAIGVGVSRALGLSPFDAYTAARLLNALCFTAIGAAALLVARRGRPLLLAALCLPMTLSLSASVGTDAELIAACVLAVALVTRAEAAARVLCPAAPAISRQPCWFAAAFLLAVVATVKSPYVPFVAILLVPLPPPGAWRAQGSELLRRIGVAGIVAVCWAIWTLLVAPHATAAVARAPYEAGPLWPGARPAAFASTDLGAQLKVLLADPLLFLSLPATTMFSDPWLVRMTIGVFGWINVFLPARLYTAWLVLLGVAAIGCVAVPGPVPRARQLLDGAMLLAAAVVTWLLIYIALYLFWTEVGHDRVDGVQGRYLIPFIPLIALALPRLSLPGGRAIEALASAGVLGLAGIGAVISAFTVVKFYYLPFP